MLQHALAKSTRIPPRLGTLRAYCSTPSKRVELLHAINEQNHDVPLHSLTEMVRQYWKETNVNRSTRPVDPAQTLLNDTHAGSLVRCIAKHYKHSFVCRNLLRWEMLRNCHRIPLMNELVALTAKAANARHAQLATKEDVLRWCIADCVQRNDISVAVDLYVSFYSHSHEHTLDKELASSIVTALAFTDPRFDRLHLAKLLELYKLFSTHKDKLVITETQAVQICNKAISLLEEPILTKAVLNRVLDASADDARVRSTRVAASYHLINEDYRRNNAAGVYYQWLRIKDSYTSVTKHDSRILFKVLRICTKHKAYRCVCRELVWKLPPQYYCNNALLLPCVMDYATRVKDLGLAERVMEDINTHADPKTYGSIVLSRRVLSTLLRMHLAFNDSEGVDRVLQQITRQHGHPSPGDYQAIVSHLVGTARTADLLKAVNMLDGIPMAQALPSVATVVNKIVDNQRGRPSEFNKASMKLLATLLDKAHRADPLHKHSLWGVVAAVYIKHLTHYRYVPWARVDETTVAKVDRPADTSRLDVAKLCYLNSRNVHWADTTPNPFVSSSPQDVRLKITSDNRPVVLRTIAMNAINVQRKDIFQWCCAELYAHGVPVEELVLDWNMMLKHQIRRSEFKNPQEVTEALELDGLDFISKALR